MAISDLRKAEVFATRGWCPVSWAHHPKEVKDELRRMGLRPMMKMCWRNSQLFFLKTNLEGVTYHEGLCMSVLPIPHSWLEYQGRVLDLTLEEPPKILSSASYDHMVVTLTLLSTMVHDPINPEKINSDYDKIWRGGLTYVDGVEE